MAEKRSLETVRRELEVEREGLARALDRLRLEADDAKRAAGRRARRGALSLVAVGGVAAAGRALLRRLRR